MNHRMVASAGILAAGLLVLGACGRSDEAADKEESALPATEAPLAKTAADPALQWGPCPPVFPSGCEIALLHGDLAKPNADLFLRVPAGYAIPAHFHSSTERMILVTGRLEVKYRGTPATMLDPGSYAFGPAKLPHKATCLSDRACTLFIAFEQPVDAEPFDGTLD